MSSAGAMDVTARTQMEELAAATGVPGMARAVVDHGRVSAGTLGNDGDGHGATFDLLRIALHDRSKNDDAKKGRTAVTVTMATQHPTQRDGPAAPPEPLDPATAYAARPRPAPVPTGPATATTESDTTSSTATASSPFASTAGSTTSASGEPTPEPRDPARPRPRRTRRRRSYWRAAPRAAINPTRDYQPTGEPRNTPKRNIRTQRVRDIRDLLRDRTRARGGS